MSDDKYNFLSRWSKRKIEAKRVAAGTATSRNAAALKRSSVPSAAESAAVRAGTQASAADAPPLPPIESLRGIASEYREFLRADVDEGVRRQALKRLFSDPHFNVMDGLDTYIDDYTKPDPIPEAMLKALKHAQGLVFDREPETRDAEAAPAGEPQAVLEPPRGEGQLESRAETGEPVSAKPADAA